MAVPSEKRCPVCAAPVPPGRRTYCSDACQQEMERRRARAGSQLRPRPGLYAERICMDCGAAYVGHIKTKRCPACQDAAKKRQYMEYRARARAGHARRLGSTDQCAVCGKDYTVESGAQKYCKDCAQTAYTEAAHQISRAWNAEHYSAPEARAERNAKRRADRAATAVQCAVCGRLFVADYASQIYCSNACRTEGQRNYMRAYDEARKEQKAAYHRKRWKELTPEQREERNLRARENYAKRKSKQSGK